MKKTEHYSFLKFPRVLIDSPVFSDLSVGAKFLFMLILDRMGVSELNAERFSDKNGEIFIIFTIKEVSEKIGCSFPTATKLFRELENKNLIIRKQKNRISPYKIYINNKFFELTELKNFTSRDKEFLSHEFKKIADNKNKYSNNKFNNNQSSIIGFSRTEEEIREQIEYDCLVCDANRKLLDEMVMIISDVLNGTSPTVRVGKDDMPRGIVVSRFCKLDSEHILYVISSLCNNKTEIKNIKAFLTTSLYNAPATMESEVTAEFAYLHQRC